jgi:hypothetical protein
MTILPGIGRHRKRRKLARLHEKCTARLAALDFDNASNIRELCSQLEEQRGRPIHLLPIELDPAYFSGFWIAVENADFIVFEANTSVPHQEHIIAHELAHIICCHRGAAALDEGSARPLFPALDPNLVRDMLRRTGYTDEQEQEAEVLATLMLQRIRPARVTPAEQAIVVRRISDSLT